MKFRYRHIIYSLLLVASSVFTGCREEVESNMMQVPVRLTIPVRESNMVRRMPAAMGDPGMAETFDFPKYAYIYLVCETQSGEETETKVSYLVGEQLDPEKWVKEAYEGALSAEGDPIYRYDGTLTIAMPEYGRKAGRVYAALSPVELTLSTAAPTTEAQVLDMTFTMSETLQTDLQNLYSSPYNYMVESKYYGTVNDITQVKPRVDLLLYHVASKVDLMWNVKTEMQSKMKVKGLTINNLYNGTCKLFKPTENVATDPISGYSLTLATDNAGTWWNGRESVYTIPYKIGTNFPIQLAYALEDTENSANETYNLTINKGMSSEVFVPWVRGQMTFTQMKSGSETIAAE